MFYTWGLQCCKLIIDTWLGNELWMVESQFGCSMVRGTKVPDPVLALLWRMRLWVLFSRLGDGFIKGIVILDRRNTCL